MNKVPRRASRYRTQPMPANDNLSKAIFGGFDGLICVWGLIAAGYATGDVRTLILGAIMLAVNEGIAMFGGSFLSELVSVYRMPHALIIGIAAFVGILLPAFPFFFAPRNVAILLAFTLTVIMAAIIAQVRSRSMNTLEAYTQTFGMTLLATALSVVGALLLRGVGV